MKENKTRWFFFVFLIFCFAGLLVIDCSFAFAQEAMPAWRKVWNNVMLFLNFGILVFVFMKYARKPLVDLLRNMCRKIEETLNTTDRQVKEAQARLDAEKAKLQAIDRHLEEIQERILKIAQTEKERIVEHGRISAQRMIENAGDYANYRLAMEKKALSDELAELAVSIAAEKLSGEISAQDNDRLIQNFLSGLETSKKHYRQALT
ncbi:MAG: ATP synthase F0 subunit B [Deltaproteobacteria bacterium]|nr:ATP synthase F0 subunit B [Deltaproteobacteria bacterium]